MTSDEDLINLSRGERKKGRKEHLLNKLLNKSKIIKSLSYKREHFKLLLDFMEKARLEKETDEDKTGFSSLTRKAQAFYLKHHPLPNPQVTLERSFNLGIPAKPQNICCVPDCRALRRYILLLKNFQGKVEQFPVCHKHRNWKHKEFRWLVGKKKLERTK